LLSNIPRTIISSSVARLLLFIVNNWPLSAVIFFLSTAREYNGSGSIGWRILCKITITVIAGTKSLKREKKFCFDYSRVIINHHTYFQNATLKRAPLNSRRKLQSMNKTS